MSTPESFESMAAEIRSGSVKALARAISLLENEPARAGSLLGALGPLSATPVTGITGAPGAGKSTLTDGLIAAAVAAGERTAVLAIDPSSPFRHGAILGDRIRMHRWAADPRVYIRSLATRGAAGGLPPGLIAIAELLKGAGFQRILIETVGVGQTEIDIARIVECCVVVATPEGGDEVQVLKSGLVEVADLFVVNKADRPGSDAFVKHLREVQEISDAARKVPVLKTIATDGSGLPELRAAIDQHLAAFAGDPARRRALIAGKAFQLIRDKRMADLTPEKLEKLVEDRGENDWWRLVREL